jgi:hypothetical protein
MGYETAIAADHPPALRKTRTSPAKFELSLIGSYVLAESCKAKLRVEASRSEFKLGRMLGHANMLDKLEIVIAEKERRNSIS